MAFAVVGVVLMMAAALTGFGQRQKARLNPYDKQVSALAKGHDTYLTKDDRAWLASRLRMADDAPTRWWMWLIAIPLLAPYVLLDDMAGVYIPVALLLLSLPSLVEHSSLVKLPDTEIRLAALSPRSARDFLTRTQLALQVLSGIVIATAIPIAATWPSRRSSSEMVVAATTWLAFCGIATANLLLQRAALIAPLPAAPSNDRLRRSLLASLVINQGWQRLCGTAVLAILFTPDPSAEPSNPLMTIGYVSACVGGMWLIFNDPPTRLVWRFAKDQKVPA